MTTLADTYAATKSQIEKLEIELKSLRADILATGQDIIEGDRCTVTVGLSERVTLDTKLARQFLTITQLAACEKTTQVETIRIKPKVAA